MSDIDRNGQTIPDNVSVPRDGVSVIQENVAVKRDNGIYRLMFGNKKASVSEMKQFIHGQISFRTTTVDDLRKTIFYGWVLLNGTEYKGIQWWFANIDGQFKLVGFDELGSPFGHSREFSSISETWDSLQAKELEVLKRSLFISTCGDKSLLWEKLRGSKVPLSTYIEIQRRWERMLEEHGISSSLLPEFVHFQIKGGKRHYFNLLECSRYFIDYIAIKPQLILVGLR